MTESKQHRQQTRAALADEQLQIALKRAVAAYKTARAGVMTDFDFDKARDEVRSIRERSVTDMERIFALFKKAAEEVDAVVHEAADGADAAEIVRRLAQERGVKLIVKSKSMLTEEIELNPRLMAAGLEVVETDLGEWIVQLAGERPSNMTNPAMHKTREQVAELFSRVLGRKFEPDIPKLVEAARNQLRQCFIDAQMGISGVNIAIAETGGIVIVTNEGNDRLVTTLPPIHVAIVGYEKLVETMDDALAILKVLSKSGTGQKQTAYVSFITGPSRTTDIEKTLTLGVHGPKELHIIFVDNGRRALAADEKCREALYCIKCGACLMLCPTFKSIGGHAFGNTYMGGIGAVVTAFHENLDSAEDTLELCTGCGYCAEICPAKVDTPGMVLELKNRIVKRHGVPLAAKVPLAALKHPRLFASVIRMARAFQSPILGGDGSVRELSILSEMLGGKKMPGLAPKFLRDILPERSCDEGAMTVSFYSGCMLDFIYPEIGNAIWDVLTKRGAQVLYPRDQGCCGAPALYLGDHETARKLAVDNLLALENGSPEYIVTGCPTCAVMLKERLPSLLQDTAWEERAVKLSGKVMDFSHFTVEVLGIKLDRTRTGKITYHDPCHQVRGLRTSGRSRDLIGSTGMELVEMEDSDECCGFAGSYSIKQAAISNSIMERKLTHIEETGAEVLATDCPGCIMQIRGGLAKHGRDVEVCHTAQLIASLLD